MSSPLRIGIAGLGTVGGGTLSILRKHKEMLEERSGRAIEIVAVSAGNKNKKRGCDISGLKWFDSPLDMVEAGNIDVIVEAIGGSEGIARELVEKALMAGKSVVTANKALIAHHGIGLAGLAEAHDAVLAFEAAVGGGIPIIKALREGLAANSITSIKGILNATCNVLLTNMAEKNQELAAAMDEAAKLGLLEADPSLDVDGHDAAHKLAILSALAFGCPPDVNAVYREGIRAVTLRDIAYARRLGYGVKLLAAATLEAGGLLQHVHPCLVPQGSYLAGVRGPLNTVLLKGDAAGEVVLQGAGGGEGPTASAVVADLMDIARGARYRPFSVPAALLKALPAVPFGESARPYYLRLAVEDKAGVLAAVTELLKRQNISVRTFLQEDHPDGTLAEIVITTHHTKESSVLKAVAAIETLETVKEKPYMIRIEDI